MTAKQLELVKVPCGSGQRETLTKTRLGHDTSTPISSLLQELKAKPRMSAANKDIRRVHCDITDFCSTYRYLGLK